jgi:antitoxin ChpS
MANAAMPGIQVLSPIVRCLSFVFRNVRHMFYIDEVKPMAKTQAAGDGFSTTSKLKKAGGSLVLTVPAAARKMLDLREGQEMTVSVKGRQVIAEPISAAPKVMKVRPPKYTLDELLEGYDADSPRTAEEQAWIDAPAAGKEVW